MGDRAGSASGPRPEYGHDGTTVCRRGPRGPRTAGTRQRALAGHDKHEILRHFQGRRSDLGTGGATYLPRREPRQLAGLYAGPVPLLQERPDLPDCERPSRTHARLRPPLSAGDRGGGPDLLLGAARDHRGDRRPSAAPPDRRALFQLAARRHSLGVGGGTYGCTVEASRSRPRGLVAGTGKMARVLQDAKRLGGSVDRDAERDRTDGPGSRVGRGSAPRDDACHPMRQPRRGS